MEQKTKFIITYVAVVLCVLISIFLAYQGFVAEQACHERCEDMIDELNCLYNPYRVEAVSVEWGLNEWKEQTPEYQQGS